MPISAVMHKVDRAKIHLDALSQLVESWEKSHFDAIFMKDDVDAGEYIVELRPPDFDFTMALVAGDFVCCLRSSLDHLTWQLFSAANPSETVPKRICFPIIETSSVDTQTFFVKSTFGISEEAIALIRSLQPYQVGGTYNTHFLWILNTIWNIDKHRHIPMHSAV